MLKLIAIAIGGALGSVLRYAVQGWIQQVVDIAFPIGTLAVNVIGCFVLGMLSGAFAGPILIREELRIGLTVGVLGGFTTFSTFGLESFSLANDGEFRLAAMYGFLSYLLGFAAVWLGYRLAERWIGV